MYTCVTMWTGSSVKLIPERKELLHGLTDLTALKLFFKVLEAFFEDRLIQTTGKKIREKLVRPMRCQKSKHAKWIRWLHKTNLLGSEWLAMML